jgi:hypothetical protein
VSKPDYLIMAPDQGENHELTDATADELSSPEMKLA